MKTGWFSRPSTGPLLKKPLLILIAVILSSSSFLLGYMAGKSNVDDSGKEIVAVRADDVTTTSSADPDMKKEADEEIVAPPSSSDTRNTEQVVKPSPDGLHEKRPGDPVAIEKISEQSPVFAVANKKPGSGEYTVQVGAFKRMKDASSLKSSLEKKGYNSYIERTKAGSSSLYKVRVGSFDIREEAEKIVHSLKKREKIDSFVLMKR